MLFTTKMLQQSSFIAVVPTDVARYYASYGMVAMLPIQLSCTMDAFGIITRRDWLLSPAAKVVLRAIKTAAISMYDTVPNAELREPPARSFAIRGHGPFGSREGAAADKLAVEQAALRPCMALRQRATRSDRL